MNRSLLSTLITSAFSKELPTGIEVTEKMLKNGTFLYAYGRLEKLSDSSYYLSRPLDSDYPFILTKQDRQLVINDLKTSCSALKVCLLIFGSIGLIAGAYCLYKQYKNYKEKKLHEEMTKNLRIERLKSQRQRLQNYDSERDNSNSDNNNIDQTCVLCLVNPREIVLLECGHFCLCIDCLDRLPNKNCPICRQTYQSFARCYIP